jgi:hypothetical protein
MRVWRESSALKSYKRSRMIVAILCTIAFVLVIVGIVFLAGGCEVAPDAEHSDSAHRIIVIAEDGYTSVFKDKRTGCEFLDSKEGYGEALAYIPGTCDKDSVK